MPSPNTSGGPTKKQRQAERRQRAAKVQAAQEQHERRLRFLMYGAFALVLALIVAGTFANVALKDDNGGTAASVAGVRSYKVPSRNHVGTPVNYAQTPPVGGDHNPAWLNCGYYDKPVASENAVHDLEHGAVWVTYQPDLPQDQVDTLRKLASDQTFVTVSPFPGLATPVVASAWGKQLELDSATDPGLDKFIRAYRVGPQTPEPGAPCTGGIGTPS